MTPQLLPPTPSPAGGSATAPTATAAADSCLSLPIPAAATVAVPLPGKPNFKLTSAIALGSPCLSLPIPLVLPNGIPSSIACFPKSPKTGPPSLSTVTPKSSTSFAIPTPEPGSQSRLTSTAGIIPLAPHPSRAGPPSLHQTTFGSARLELYDCSDVNLLLRQPLALPGTLASDAEHVVLGVPVCQRQADQFTNTHTGCEQDFQSSDVAQSQEVGTRGIGLRLRGGW